MGEVNQRLNPYSPSSPQSIFVFATRPRNGFKLLTNRSIKSQGHP